MMDNPGTSLFQGVDININNSQNNEEEEDLEDQMRRREELQNLLTNALDDFKYEDSTINSSTNISMVSMDELQQNYKEAQTPNDQLKVLYEVRMRELDSLRREHEKYKVEMVRENEGLKSKLILSEAEIRQLQISLKNAEELLVDKTDIIAKMSKSFDEKDQKIKNYEKTIENLNNDICIYNSTITELQLKLQGPNALFNANKMFNSEEQQTALQEKIAKMEVLLDEQTKKAKISEKEKSSLEQDLKNFIAEKEMIENDNQKHITSLAKTLESAQQQCTDLINVIEMLHKENEHLQGRLQDINDEPLNISEGSKSSPVDNATLLKHAEKLKKMLLDKSVEIDTLKMKLRHYETDIRELLEYRQLKAEVYKKEFQQCNNASHTKDLLLLQNDIQNYRRTIDDKNQQIFNLNSINKELQEKIEEMLLQTRNEIQNLSQKYSLPQLEVMSEELKNAEARVRDLTEKLEKSEDKRRSLIQKFNRKTDGKENTLQHELDKAKIRMDEMKKIFDKEKEKYENIVSELQNQVDLATQQISDLKSLLENSNAEKCKLLANLESKAEFDDKFLREKCDSLQDKLKDFEETLQELNNAKTITEGELCSARFELKDAENQLEQARKHIVRLNGEIEELKEIVGKNDGKRSKPDLVEFDNIKLELSKKEEMLGIIEKEKVDLQELLDKNKIQLAELQDEVFNLQKELAEAREKTIRRNFEKGLKEAENQLEQSKNEGDNIEQSDLFNRAVQTEILKKELQLRDEIQAEFLNKVRDIEKKYQKACHQANELSRQKSEKLESLESKYRAQFMKIIEDCTETVGALEKEKKDLMRQLTLLQREFDEFKINTMTNENKYREMLTKMEIQSEKNIRAWQKWSRQFVTSCLNIEATNKVVRDKILTKMQEADSEVAAIEKKYNDKLTKHYLKNGK